MHEPSPHGCGPCDEPADREMGESWQKDTTGVRPSIRGMGDSQDGAGMNFKVGDTIEIEWRPERPVTVNERMYEAVARLRSAAIVAALRRSTLTYIEAEPCYRPVVSRPWPRRRARSSLIRFHQARRAVLGGAGGQEGFRGSRPRFHWRRRCRRCRTREVLRKLELELTLLDRSNVDLR